MPLFEQLTRLPGSPIQSQVSGAPPTPALTPRVNPPAPAAGPQGRPPRPSTPPGPTGSALPVFPGATRPAAAPVGPGSPQRPPAAPQSRPVPPTSGPGGPGVGTTAPGAVPGTPGGMALQLDHLPGPADLVGLPEGVQVTTPFGTVDRSGNLTLSPDGAQRYREAVVAKQREYGPHPFAGDPNAPAPPIRLGKANFNPFLGRWLR